MRFLLQKVLKQSDVGSLGRIVLPKVIFLVIFFYQLLVAIVYKFIISVNLDCNLDEIFCSERGRNPFARAGGKRWNFHNNGRHWNFTCLEHAL